ncbi:hypothetical protein HYT26_03210 [Candidatus Pacearchaeota archaeon]|nr:hypothetical protein [Candidatus Pacearchaeota archaeon]
MNKEKRFAQILKHIKDIKIQGARSIARAALYAYSLMKTKEARKQLIKARPTEPMLSNVLRRIEKQPYKKILQHFDYAQQKINKFAFRIIKNNSTIFTHCHSTNVANALIYAKRHGKSRLITSTFGYAIRAWINIIRIYRDYEPLKFFGIIGSLIFSVGFVIGLYLVYLHFTTGIVGHLPLMMLDVLILSIGLQIIIFGFIADMNRK